MIKKIQFPFIILMIILVLGFLIPPKKQGIKALIAYYKTNINEYVKIENDGDLQTTIRFIPYDFETIRLLKESEQMAEEFQNEKQTTYSFNIQLTIPSTGLQEFLHFESDTLNFENKVSYYSFNFKNNIHYQWDNGPIMSITDFHFERLFNISPTGNFNIKIPINSKKAKTLKVIIKDVIYDKSFTQFQFDVKSIKEFPRLDAVKKLNSKTSK